MDASTVSTAMDTAFKAIQGDALGAIKTVAPYAIGIMGAGLVWRIGARFFKSVAK